MINNFTSNSFIKAIKEAWIFLFKFILKNIFSINPIKFFWYESGRPFHTFRISKNALNYYDNFNMRIDLKAYVSKKRIFLNSIYFTIHNFIEQLFIFIFGCLCLFFDRLRTRLIRYLDFLFQNYSLRDLSKSNFTFNTFSIAIAIFFVFTSSFVFGASVDLALSQTVSNASPILGGQVKYTVSLINQGNTTASNIVVEDVVPKDGINTIVGTASLGTWSYNSTSGIGTWTVVSLAPNQTVTLEIVGNAIGRGVYFNIAEIKTSPDTDIDSVPGNSLLFEDDTATSCFTVPILWFQGDEYLVEVPSPFSYGTGIVWFRDLVPITTLSVEATVNPNGSLIIKAPGSYTFSTTLTTCPASGCCPILVQQGPIFDLALRKTSVSTSVVAGGQITFSIEILNQGNIVANSIQFSDYIPVGLTLADPDWVLNGNTATLVTPIASLAPNASTIIDITFNIGVNSSGQITNTAEISSASGPNGQVVTDIDSTPDGVSTNDGTSKDNVITENGKTGGDEDDSDLATITVVPAPVFDLALRKTLNTAGPLYPGSSVIFNVDIYNQGTVMATNIFVTDYIPNGLTLNDPNWTQTGNLAVTNNPNFTILAGQSVPLTITFKVNDSFLGTALTNSAEISSAKGPVGENIADIDSTPDAISTNDGNAIDDELNQNGKTGGDQDDADFANITIIPLASLGNMAWLDVNKNGTQDVSEIGISGVSVILQRPDASFVASAITQIDGQYLFTKLLPGSYVVAFGKPSGYVFTRANRGVDAADSDADSLSGKTGTYALSPGEINLTADVGFYLQSCPDIVSIAALNAEICAGDSTSLSAISSNGTPIDWYLVPSGGVSFKTTNSGANFVVKPSAPTMYYAHLTTINNGCPITRTPIEVFVNTKPSIPVNTNVVEVCTGLTTNLNTHIINGITTPDGVFQWRVGSNPSSALVANPTTVGAGIYYLFEKSVKGCYSNPAILTVVSKNCEKIIDISLLKTADKRIAALNENIIFNLLISNAGPDIATNIKIEDRLPAGLTFVSSGTLTNNSGVLSTTIPTLNVGQSTTFNYTAKANLGGSIINVAEVVSADQRDSDSTPGNGATINEDDDDDEVLNITIPSPLADLSLEKLVNTSSPKIGDNITYTVRVSNAGPATATNVEVVDILPLGLSLVSATGADVINTVGSTITAKFNSILMNGQKEFTIIANVTGTGSITNRAQVTKSDQGDPDSVPNAGSDEDDDDLSIINVVEPCNPSTPFISTINPYICASETINLSSIGCNGIVEWSNGMTGTSIMVNPLVTTIYTARCKVGICFSAVSNTLQIIVNSILPPTVTTSANTVCPGGSVILTATGCTGIITWSNGALGSSIQVSPTLQVSNYTATCKVANCFSGNSNTLTITLGNSPTAPTISSIKSSICLGESLTLTATGCTGVVNWSNGQVGASISAAPINNAIYTATCTVGSCISLASNSLNITVGTSQAPTITASIDNTCGGQSVTLTTNCSNNILWSTGATTSSINVIPAVTTTYSVSCGSGTCSASANKIITVGGLGQTPTLTSSKSSICNGEEVTLTATSCSGTISWTQGTSLTVIGSNATLKVTPNATTSYKATCSTGTSCSGFATTAINVSIKPESPIVTTGLNRVCAGADVVFTAHNCIGIVNWSNGTTGATITVNPIVNTSYSATCNVNGCASLPSTVILIQIITQIPKITASSESVCAGGNVTLTASDCSGTIAWSTGSTAASIILNPTTETVYTLTCTLEGCVGKSTKTITIGTGQLPSLTATKTNACAGESVTITATNCSSSIAWSTGTVGNTLIVNPALTTIYTATCGSGSCSGTSNITINVSTGQTPTLSASNTSVCVGQEVTINSSNCSSNISWSTGETTASIKVSPLATTTYTVTCGAGSCVKSAQIIININGGSVAPIIASTSNQLCQAGSVTLTATGCTGTVKWSNDQTGASITLNVTDTKTFSATCTVGTCVSNNSNILTINVGKPAAPVISASQTTVCKGSSLTLNATGCSGGRIIWSNAMEGTSISVTPSLTTFYFANCDAGSCQSLQSNAISIVVSGNIMSKPTVKDLVNTCPLLTVDLASGVTSQPSQGGSFIFKIGTAPNSLPVSNVNAISSTASYYVFETSGTSCLSEPSKINVSIISCSDPVPNCTTSPATASAGNSSIVCLNDNFIEVKGIIGGAARSSTWSSSGTGIFENSLNLTTKYFYSFQDIQNRNVILSLTTNDPDGTGPCIAAKSSITVTINAVKTLPTITSSKSPIICIGDSVILTANPEGAFSYEWSNGATTRAINVKLPGIYSVKFKGTDGCKSLTSTPVTVDLNTSITPPAVLALSKNTCPAITVDLKTKVTSLPITVGGVFEYHIQNNPNSAILASSNVVGAGDYYVFEKTTTGCYSAGSKINVSIDNCNVVQIDADIQVEITGDKSIVALGDLVVFTIKIKNNGPAIATNVKISNELPNGLLLVGATPGLILSGSNLIATIASMNVGSELIYLYTTKLEKPGLMVNTIKKISADQNDPVSINNQAHFDVECTTCQLSCISIALKADTIRQANGSFNIKFTALVNNCGNTNLSGVEIEENLADMFKSPTSFTIIQKPTPNIGSTLVGNDGFNGAIDKNVLNKTTSTLAPSKTDTVVFVINLIPASTEVPYSTNSIAKGIGMSIFGIAQDVSDVSNDGKIIIKTSSEPTVVKLFKSPSIGIVLSVKDTLKLSNNSYNVTFQAIVKNMGTLKLDNVVITDTLNKYFKIPASYTMVGAPVVVNSNTQLIANSAFNGASDTRITLPASVMAVGKSDTLNFKINIITGNLKQFENQAIARGIGAVSNGKNETVVDISNSGIDVNEPGSSPTQLIIGNQGAGSEINACLGIALTTINKVKQTDASFNITYQAIIKNCGNLNLTNISICDTLSNTFTAGTQVKMVSKPSANLGANLKVDTTFNGVAKNCLLISSNSSMAPGKVDTLKWTLNVKLNSNNGPFRNNVLVTSTTPSGRLVSDISNDGVNPAPEGSFPTILNFDRLSDTLIGLAKSLVSITEVPNKFKFYDIEFKFVIKNYGIVKFDRVQLIDNLALTFGDKVIIDSVAIKDIEPGLVANVDYTGKGDLTYILTDTLSSLAVNGTKSLSLLVRVDMSLADTTKFENIALAVGYVKNSSTDDASVSGLNPDRDLNGTPANDSDPTIIEFKNLDVFPLTPLGIAKAIVDTVASADGSYLVIYSVIIKNFGKVKLDSVQLTDNLADIFSNNTQFSAIGIRTLNVGSKLKVNLDFDGKSDNNLLIADSSSILAGVSDTLTFQVKISNDDLDPQTYKNSILGTALSDKILVTDISTNGFVPDKNGDLNPGNDSETTDLTLKPSYTLLDTTAIKVFITNGLSPDGNSQNDILVIKDEENKVVFTKEDNIKVMIYNRWGHMVYRSENYVEDAGSDGKNGWDGRVDPKLGLRIDKDKYVPDGTYYYVVTSTNLRLFGGKPAVDFITIKR